MLQNNGTPGAPEASRDQAGEKETKLATLAEIALELGDTADPPTSIGELVERNSMLNESNSWTDVIKRAHELGVLSDGVSNNIVDLFRATIESTQAPRDKPFYQVVKEEDDVYRIGEDSALDQWDDLELLLGIDKQTTPEQIDALSRENGTGTYEPKVKSGMVMFQTQGFGPWGKDSMW